MAERDAYPHGVFNWVDLQTGDTDAAKAFYAELFGLDFTDDQMDGVNVYTVGFKNDRPVLGMMAQPAELTEAGVPYFWETYIKVDDADTAADAVAPAGGTLLGPVTDVANGAGRLAVIADPTGAVAVLWEPGSHHGAGLVKEHGTMTWQELITDDVDAAMQFYSALLGWTAEPMGAGGLVGIRQGDEVIGTASPAPEGVPAHWAVYFAVDDCDETADLCVRLGGRTVIPAADMPPGRMARLADDQGASFWVINCDNS